MIRILLFCLLSLLSSPGLLLARDVFFYHNDNTGTPVAMTDSSGKVVWRAHDKPFGEEFQTTEAPEHNSRRFIGKEKDKETGLVYIGARYLDPASGRFLQPDPVGPVDPMTGKVNVEMLTNPQRLNRYAYGLNNPYRYIDPDGEWAEAVLLEGPSIAVGVHSFQNNMKQGSYGAAAVDAVGIALDSAALAAPGIPGGAGLGIKALKNTQRTTISEGRKIADTLAGSHTVKNAQGEAIKRVDFAPSKPHDGLSPHTHPNFRNILPDGSVRSGVSRQAQPVTRKDIIDASRKDSQRTGGR